MKEFKIVEFRKKDKDPGNIERKLAEYANNGWDVISMTSDLSRDISGVYIVLLQRDVRA